MNNYKVLHNQIFSYGCYQLVPIRYEDRYDIMKWRNEQIFHLRQSEPLTKESQDSYFNEVVSKLFIQDNPNQILFSFLKEDKCIGYGGLVHINWIDKNAEISFIMDTKLEKENFISLWKEYLRLIKLVAFKELSLHKIYTYAFDIRPQLYVALELAGFTQDAILKDHCYISQNFEDVIIHSSWNGAFNLKEATPEEKDKAFYWVNHEKVREFSFNKNEVLYEDHLDWYQRKLNDSNCIYLMAFDNDKVIGSIRFDIEDKIANLSYLVDPNCFGRGYGTRILKEGIEKLQRINSNVRVVTGSVMKKNSASLHIFRKLDFTEYLQNSDYLFKLEL
ncbi:GNAT family N-acetyltransferase [Nonlabens sp. MIC269]|uniref:GNAT family N-acetyltransferase n=1 Tax=Nonlabens sp. MIC269 TaxID=1476901 RepID=UPI0009E85A15|nr:GNAT family N-acetyltransferase [Nonlabens sp. MIC269]